VATVGKFKEQLFVEKARCSDDFLFVSQRLMALVDFLEQHHAMKDARHDRVRAA
jgi:hypothetical protein